MNMEEQFILGLKKAKELLPKECHEIKDSGETRISGAMYAMQEGKNMMIEKIRNNLDKEIQNSIIK